MNVRVALVADPQSAKSVKAGELEDRRSPTCRRHPRRDRRGAARPSV